MKTLLLAGLGIAAASGFATESLELEGTTLDLNGSSRMVSALISANANSKIVNSGAPATLTIGADDASSSFIGEIGANITLVKIGTGTIDLGATKLGVGALRVDAGTLKVAQSKTTSARYVRFMVLDVNPWRTVNKGSMAQMGYLGLCLGTTELTYPEGTTATNDDATHSDASKVLTWTHTQETDWAVSSYPASFTIDMLDQVSFDGYRIAGATISTGRSPYHFTVDVSQDGEEWFRFDEQKTFCTCGYGVDYDLTGKTTTSCYAPRMEAIYPMNPFPVFVSNATVTVASDATLELNGVCGRVPSLTGAGTLKLVGARPTLTGDSSFTGTVAGYGTLAVATENDTIGFRCGTLTVSIVNESRARSWSLTGTEVAPAYLPAVSDSEAAPLSLTLAGPISRPKTVIKVDRFENEIEAVPLHGTNTLCGSVSIAYVDAPVCAKYVRFAPLYGRGGTTSMIGELELSRDGTVLTTPTLKHCFSDWYKTTNYTSGVMSDQAASYYRYDREAKLFDGNPESYYQQNNASPTKTTDDTLSSVYQFDSIVCFDAVNLWMPSFSTVANGAYLLCYWNLETSLDGNTWEAVIPSADNTKALGDWGSTAYNRGKIGTWSFEQTAGDPGKVPSADYRYLISGERSIAANRHYVRLWTTEIGGISEPFGTGSFFDLGEIELHANGAKVDWPEGSTAWFTDASQSSAAGAIDATQQLPRLDWQGYEENQLYGGSKAQHDFSSSATVQAGVGIVIDTLSQMTFDSYRLFCGDNWDGVKRHLTKWKLQVSYDNETYYDVDTADRETNFTPFSRWMAFQWYCSRSVDFTEVQSYQQRDDFSDEHELAIGPDSVLRLTSVHETIGGLSGNGQVILTASELTIQDGNSTFAGTIASTDGTLIVDGGTLTLAKADLRDLERIVLKNGATLKGKAYYDDRLAFEVEEGCTNSLRKAGLGTMLLIR